LSFAGHSGSRTVEPYRVVIAGLDPAIHDASPQLAAYLMPTRNGDLFKDVMR
jgi:hypothetical protein